MNPNPILRPDLAAACLFAQAPRRRDPQAPLPPSGVLAELARRRLVR